MSTRTFKGQTFETVYDNFKAQVDALAIAVGAGNFDSAADAIHALTNLTRNLGTRNEAARAAANLPFGSVSPGTVLVLSPDSAYVKVTQPTTETEPVWSRCRIASPFVIHSKTEYLGSSEVANRLGKAKPKFENQDGKLALAATDTLEVK